MDQDVFEEIMAENFPNLKKETRYAGTRSTESPTPRHIIIKMAKVIEDSKGSKRKRVSYKGTPIRLSTDFSTETLQARREWQALFQVLKGKNLQPRILYPARLSFRLKGERKNFSIKN